MAQRTVILLEDDIDGGEAAETISFSLDGVTYEIDLNEGNARSLRDDFAKWVGRARRAGGRKQAASRRSATSRANLNDMRTWGRANGFEVSDRGRVSAALQEAYAKAH